VMWTFSSKRMLHLYGEKRMYVTDLHYDDKRLPNTIFLFLTEYGTEIEIPIEKIQLLKRYRLRESELYRVVLLDGKTVLLKLDHRRGNHFVYCRLETYDQLINTYLDSRENTASLKSPNSTSLHMVQLEPLKHKIILIDSELIPECVMELDSLLKENEIILSPYYGEWLDSHIADPSRLNEIHRDINRLESLYPHKMITDQYVDLESRRNQQLNLSDDKEYLLLLAQQLNVTASQIVILTRDEEWKITIQMQGYHAVISQFPSPTTMNQMLEDKQDNLVAFQQTLHQSLLPPRSMRHKN
jgi:hypothetical protein